jgi:hypothetical protein
LGIPLSQRHTFGMVACLAEVCNLAPKLALVAMKRLTDLVAALGQRLSFIILVSRVEFLEPAPKSCQFVS